MGRVKRVGYFGGTFDPPHLGHLILAREVYYQMDLDMVQWILTPEPPHKADREITSLANRVDMLKLIKDNYPEFELCTVDMDRKPPHFAADTVELIKKNDPRIELVYIIGEDSLRDLPEWKDVARFLAYVDILAVAPRPDVASNIQQLNLKIPGIQEKIQFLNGIQVDISSSLIRERIKEGAPYKHFLPEGISLYLEENKLYN